MKDAQTTVKGETAEVLDETTREALNDYTRKFAAFIQHEKERVRKLALEDAEKITAEGERKAHAAYEKAMRDAGAESEAILAQARGSVEKMASEVGRLSEAIANLKEKVEKDIDDVAARLSRQGEAVAEALRKGEQVLEEARAKLQTNLETSATAIAELKEDLSGQVAQVGATATAGPPAETPAESRKDSTASAKPRETEEPAAAKPAEAEAKPRESTPRRHAERTFVGPLKIELYRGNPALYRRFSEGLAKTPNLEISQIEDAIGDRMRMVVVASQPVPLLTIISQMNFVRSAVADEDRLKVVLHQTDRWMS